MNVAVADRLVRAVWPKQYPLNTRFCWPAWKLKRTLVGVHLRLEIKAVKKKTGLAGILYSFMAMQG